MDEENHFEDVLPEIKENTKKLIRQKRRRNLGLIFLGLVVVNCILSTVYIDSLLHIFPLKRNLGMLSYALAIWGFVLGLLFALIPQKKMTYKQKYLSTSLIVSIVLSCLYLFVMVVPIVKEIVTR